MTDLRFGLMRMRHAEPYKGTQRGIELVLWTPKNQARVVELNLRELLALVDQGTSLLRTAIERGDIWEDSP